MIDLPMVMDAISTFVASAFSDHPWITVFNLVVFAGAAKCILSRNEPYERVAWSGKGCAIENFDRFRVGRLDGADRGVDATIVLRLDSRALESGTIVTTVELTSREAQEMHDDIQRSLLPSQTDDARLSQVTDSDFDAEPNILPFLLAFLVTPLILTVWLHLSGFHSEFMQTMVFLGPFCICGIFLLFIYPRTRRERIRRQGGTIYWSGGTVNLSNEHYRAFQLHKVMSVSTGKKRVLLRLFLGKFCSKNLEQRLGGGDAIDVQLNCQQARRAIADIGNALAAH